MDLRANLLAPCVDANNGVDFAALLQRLILFDRYVIASGQLREVPVLAERFGPDALSELLNSGAVAFKWAPNTMAQTGNLRNLPRLSYEIDIVTLGKAQEALRNGLAPLERLDGVSKHKGLKLRGAVERALVANPQGLGTKTIVQLRSDTVNRVELVKRVVSGELERLTGQGMQASQFQLAFHLEGDRRYHAETDLVRLGVGQDIAHEAVAGGLLALANVAHVFESMEAFSAIQGFQPRDLPLLEDRLGVLLNDMSPTKQEERFTRVLRLADFPGFSDPEMLQRANLEKLIQIRKSSECVEFRQWLRTTDEISDQDLKARIDSLRAKVAMAMGGTAAKVVRFLTTTGVGFIPVVGQVAGPVASAVDTFLLDKVFPRSGPLAFLEELLPSMFK